VAHEDDPGRLVADHLDVVGDRRVPEQIVARPQVDDVVALQRAQAAGEDQVVLLAAWAWSPVRVPGGMIPSNIRTSRG
jgi:hypothetical protein